MPSTILQLQTDPVAAMDRYGGDDEVMGVLAKLTTFDMSFEQRQEIEDLGASPDDLAQTIYKCVVCGPFPMALCGLLFSSACTSLATNMLNDQRVKSCILT